MRGRASHTSHVPRVVRWLGEKKGTALQSKRHKETVVAASLIVSSIGPLVAAFCVLLLVLLLVFFLLIQRRHKWPGNKQKRVPAKGGVPT